jgi:hypothetical protein
LLIFEALDIVKRANRLHHLDGEIVGGEAN